VTGLMSFSPKCRTRKHAAVLAIVALGAGAMLAMTPGVAAASAPRPHVVPGPVHLPWTPSSCLLLPPGLPGQRQPIGPGAPGCVRRPGDVSGAAQVPLQPSPGVRAWSIVSTLNPQGQAGAFSAVSCTSASACTAVGSSENSTGAEVMLAERWNGTAWAIQHIPSPRGAETSALDAVSCTSASACTAAGTYAASTGTDLTLAERWNGTAWAIQHIPNPRGAAYTNLVGVSCASASVCTAIGDYRTSTGIDLTLAERWNGTAWTIQHTLNPGGAKGSELYGVSCTSAAACTAAGSYQTSTGQVTLAERWNGTAWAIQHTPDQNGALNGFLDAVSCTSASACIATGSYDQGTLAERWNGTAWAIQHTPNPPDAAYSDLDGVSCTSVSACTATGYYTFGPPGPLPTLAERWNGTAWTIESTPNPGGAYGSGLSGVSCTSASACTAAGSYSTSASTGVTLAVRWNGTAWAIQPTPNPRGARDSFLYGVSCTSASACTATGSYSASTGTELTLAERWNGRAWAIQHTLNPGGAYGSGLRGVSCTSASACTAAGSYGTSASTGVTLAERWNGTAWAIQPTPNPSGATQSQLLDVSCTSASACTATGLYNTSTGQVTLAERWNGTAWTIQPTPNPRGATDSELYAVSCASASACTAAGYYSTSTGTDLTLAERWNGTAWTIQHTLNPGGAHGSALAGVSCASASACTATGYYNTSTAQVTLAERWNGTAWSIQHTPSPGGAHGSALIGVSCTSASACTATGSYGTSTYTGATLAERWNGSVWAIQPTPNPRGASGSTLSEVSCTSVSACTATGTYTTDYNVVPFVTLAERYS
jgi:hypothetical protein